jgi:hypothetical protein
MTSTHVRKRMQIRRGTAVQILLWLWISFTAIASLMFLIQSSNGRFGDEYQQAWSWLAALIVPPLSILLITTLTDSSIGWHDGVASNFKFALALFSSCVLVVAGLTIIFAEPLLQQSYFQLFNETGLAATLWQGLTVPAIGAVILEGR